MTRSRTISLDGELMANDREHVLVTGGAGFIGSSLVRHLLTEGRRVTVADRVRWRDARLLHGVRDGPPDAGKLRYVEADITSAEACRKLVTGQSVIFHLASNTENRAALAVRDTDSAVTLGGTITMLEAAAGADTEAFILASSQLVYGSGNTGVVPEDQAVRPESRFAAAKAAAEAFLSAYARESGFRGVACRLSNVVGEHMRRGVVFDLASQLARDPARLTVLGDGRQARNFLYVDDCVTALLAASEHGASEHGAGPFDVFNVCGAETTSIARVAEIVCAESGAAGVAVRFGSGASGWAGDVPVLEMSAARLRACGWRPQVGSDEAVRRMARAVLGRRGREETTA